MSGLQQLIGLTVCNGIQNSTHVTTLSTANWAGRKYRPHVRVATVWLQLSLATATMYLTITSINAKVFHVWNGALTLLI
jgi:hypothetical protein